MFYPLEIVNLFNYTRSTSGFNNDTVVSIAGIHMQALVTNDGFTMGSGRQVWRSRNLYTLRRVAYNSKGTALMRADDPNGRGWGLRFTMKKADSSEIRPLLEEPAVFRLRPRYGSVVNGCVRVCPFEGNEGHFSHDATLLRLFSTVWEPHDVMIDL
jgi:hypothetical protein